jgi:MoxR-like ATPase
MFERMHRMEMKSWKIFHGEGDPHDGLDDLPDPPPWRLGGKAKPIGARPSHLDVAAEASRAAAFLPEPEMISAVNAALYLRRPLLLTGKPGTGKSSLISKVANELKLGRVLRWPITSRATVRGGAYSYDPVGRLQAGKGDAPPVEEYLTLGPLGTALAATEWPRALLIDEIDKSDLDFANDLLNVIEEGIYEIPELQRLGQSQVTVRDADGRPTKVHEGRLDGGQFPFVVMTSNGEREFPAPFLRRCVRLNIQPPDRAKLTEIVNAHLADLTRDRQDRVATLIDDFETQRREKELSIDQLLNAVFLTVAMDDGARAFTEKERSQLRDALFQQNGGVGA